MKERIYTRLRSDKGFYVGELLYAMGDEDYDGDWQSDHSDIEGVHRLRGHTFALACIGDSDRTYTDSKGRTYEVESGHIGILPLELCEKSMEEMQSKGQIVNTQLAFFDANKGVVNVVFNNGECIVIEENMDYNREETKQYAEIMKSAFGVGGQQ